MTPQTTTFGCGPAPDQATDHATDQAADRAEDRERGRGGREMVERCQGPPALQHQSEAADIALNRQTLRQGSERIMQRPNDDRGHSGRRRETRFGGVRFVGIFVPWQAVALTLAVVVGLTAFATTRGSDPGKVRVEQASSDSPA